ncbi:MAG: hypothetical protein WBC94_00860 [Xanthobacteraceae bacterium]
MTDAPAAKLKRRAACPPAAFRRYRIQLPSMTPIRAERARIPRRSGGSFLRHKYGKVAVGERCRAGRDLAGIGKFDAEGQSVTLDQAAAPMRCAAGRQEQKKPVRQFDVILEIKPSATIRNIGNRTSKSRRIFVLLDLCGVVKMAPPLLTQFSATIAGSDHRSPPSPAQAAGDATGA